jgi:phage host-nuclease inhibitor protein Gam
MLQSALATEVAAYIERHQDELDERGLRLVVRNGKARTRKVTCGAGTFEIRAPRVNDKPPDRRAF